MKLVRFLSGIVEIEISGQGGYSGKKIVELWHTSWAIKRGEVVTIISTYSTGKGPDYRHISMIDDSDDAAIVGESLSSISGLEMIAPLSDEDRKPIKWSDLYFVEEEPEPDATDPTPVLF